MSPSAELISHVATRLGSGRRREYKCERRAHLRDRRRIQTPTAAKDSLTAPNQQCRKRHASPRVHSPRWNCRHTSSPPLPPPPFPELGLGHSRAMWPVSPQLKHAPPPPPFPPPRKPLL